MTSGEVMPAVETNGNGSGAGPRPSGPGLPSSPGGGLRRFVKPVPGPGGLGAPAGGSSELLRRFETSQRPRPRPGEACELCATPVSAEHDHVVNVETRELKCVCRACYLLFTKEGAAQGKFRAVPDRYLVDPYFQLDKGTWEQIQIPVSMAFFFYNSSLERFVAFYPSPAGATESLLDLDAWREVMAANPSFEGLLPDVEALIVKAEEDRFECYLVPIDSAYELTAVVRMNWKGFSGGEEVWDNIESFFSTLRGRSAVVGLGPRGARSEAPPPATGGETGVEGE
ncbi:MAG TPA: DUF5947 family protein [Actinomycetota bacterium]|nr:DUF5947 family protein [Actinomycetota bacterium]